MDKSHKLTLRTLTLNKEGVKKERENIAGGQECAQDEISRIRKWKLDHHVSAGRKRDGYKHLPVSVEFPKYGNTLFRPVVVEEERRLLLPPL